MPATREYLHRLYDNALRYLCDINSQVELRQRKSPPLTRRAVENAQGGRPGPSHHVSVGSSGRIDDTARSSTGTLYILAHLDGGAFDQRTVILIIVAVQVVAIFGLKLRHPGQNRVALAPKLAVLAPRQPVRGDGR
jgi:hypothetical protein